MMPINPYLSYGVSVGYAMSSDNKINTTQASAYVQNAIYCGDVNLVFNKSIGKKITLLVFGGGGIRHFNKTQILVNSDREVSQYNAYYTGLGWKGGAGVSYAISTNYFAGLKYKLDLYGDGFDYFGAYFGYKLN